MVKLVGLAVDGMEVMIRAIHSISGSIIDCIVFISIIWKCKRSCVCKMFGCIEASTSERVELHPRSRIFGGLNAFAVARHLFKIAMCV